MKKMKVVFMVFYTFRKEVKSLFIVDTIPEYINYSFRTVHTFFYYCVVYNPGLYIQVFSWFKCFENLLYRTQRVRTWFKKNIKMKIYYFCVSILY